jgi:5,10-methylene-tetrahydrofolate dehydrogenase/methenyl tetrahydrofolate cyclohydrolase
MCWSGRIKSGDLTGHLTCTPAGVIELIKAAGITIQVRSFSHSQSIICHPNGDGIYF